MTLAQFRAAQEAGGFTAARVIGIVGEFHIAADAVTGETTVLVRNADKSPRLFIDPTTALRLLRDVGFAEVTVDLRQWLPGRAQIATAFSRQNIQKWTVRGASK